MGNQTRKNNDTDTSNENLTWKHTEVDVRLIAQCDGGQGCIKNTIFYRTVFQFLSCLSTNKLNI